MIVVSIVLFFIGIILVIVGAWRGLTLERIVMSKIPPEDRIATVGLENIFQEIKDGRLTGFGGGLPGFQMKKKTLIFNWEIFIVGIVLIIIGLIFVII
jgi:hypothetical protein